MSAKTNSTTAPRTIYASPCGRVRVERDGPRDFALYLDGVYVQSYAYSYQAEHEGGVWLHEQTQELVAILADEAAMRDAVIAGEIDADLTFDLGILGIIRTPTHHS
jgi:hypothetical protein